MTSAKTTVFHAGTLEVLQHEEETAGNERSQVEDGDGAWTSYDHPRVEGLHQMPLSTSDAESS